MSNSILKQQCLELLAAYGGREGGLITREVSDALDISVYQARILLLTLQDEGVVRQVPGRKPGRGAALHWRII